MALHIGMMKIGEQFLSHLEGSMGLTTFTSVATLGPPNQSAFIFKSHFGTPPLLLSSSGGRLRRDNIIKHERLPVCALTNADDGAGRRLKAEKIERLWIEFFADPSQWWDNRSSKDPWRW